MSDVVGHLAVHAVAHLLQHINGGSGVLLGGLLAADRPHVAVLYPGTVGTSAATLAAALGASVKVFGTDRSSLERMHRLGDNVTALPSFATLLEQVVPDADQALRWSALRPPRIPCVRMRYAYRVSACVVEHGGDDAAVDHTGIRISHEMVSA